MLTHLMVATSLPVWTQVVVAIVGVVAGVGALVGLVAGAVYIVRSRKISTNNTLADSAVASLTSANQALESRLDLLEKDNEHCLRLKEQQDKVIEAQNARIGDLEKWVTARDLVEELAQMTRRAFEHQGVPPEVLQHR